MLDDDARCVEYTCYFKPFEERGRAEGAVSRDAMKWYEPNRGYLSVRLTYDMHFDAEDLAWMKAHIDDAMIAMAEAVLARFGGKLLERYVEP